MSPKYSAWFQCFAGCDERYELDEIVYRCKKCNSLLEVRHDTDALAQTPGQAWRDLFDRRWRSISGPASSGVWAKQEWVMPRVDEQNIVTLGEGYNELLKIDRFGRRIGVPEVYVKLCGNSHTDRKSVV